MSVSLFLLIVSAFCGIKKNIALLIGLKIIPSAPYISIRLFNWMLYTLHAYHSFCYAHCAWKKKEGKNGFRTPMKRNWGYKLCILKFEWNSLIEYDFSFHHLINCHVVFLSCWVFTFRRQLTSLWACIVRKIFIQTLRILDT